MHSIAEGDGIDKGRFLCYYILFFGMDAFVAVCIDEGGCGPSSSVQHDDPRPDSGMRICWLNLAGFLQLTTL